ncbi:Nuclear receptor sub 2 group C member 2 [Actinomortierella ambigua]|nr:Nuclear receptor sub 2 group C member 2 [Actinomortierella ambigua]
MTVPVVPVDPEILHILQYNTPYIPFDELSRVSYNAHVPGRFGSIHTGRWGEFDVEIREPFGDITTIDKEVRLLTKLKACQKIQRLHGYTIEPSTSLPHYVLQHNEHGTLHSYLSNFHPHLSWADRYNLALDIALGLRYLHQKGYRHRHLHSASILIDENGSACLSDFGSPRDSQVLSSREYHARWSYIAPERLVKSPNNNNKYSAECDIYSLGMVFWEISSGRPPFEGLGYQHNNQVIQNVLAGQREEPIAGTDPTFQDLYTRCWSANPHERPSLDEIIEVLGVLLKKPSNFLARQLEALSIAEEQDDEVSKHISAPLPPRSTTPKPIGKVVQSMPIKFSDFPMPPQHIGGEPQLRSQELSISPREQDFYPPRMPPPPHMSTPLPPIPQRRKMSTVSNSSTVMAPTSRSMSVSSGSSSGSSSSSSVPAIPARDSRRVSAMTSHSADYSRYEFPVKQQPARHGHSMWEACQQGHADMVDWHIIHTNQNPDAMAPLPAYSMFAEVTALHVACFYQPEELMAVIRTLQRHGATLNAVTTHLQQTALHILLENARNYTLALEATKFLILEGGLNVNEPDSRGLTPFHKYIRNPHLSAITSVAGSELYTLLRDKGNANLTFESHHDGNALGMTARFLRFDLMKHFLLTDLSISEPKSLAYASSIVEAPLNEGRNSKTLQAQCRALLAEWRSERGETKRIEMAERILNQPNLSGMGVGTTKKSGKSSKSSSPVDPALMGLSPKAIQEIEMAKRLMASAMVKQRKLKNLISSSGF